MSDYDLALKQHYQRYLGDLSQGEAAQACQQLFAQTLSELGCNLDIETGEAASSDRAPASGSDEISESENSSALPEIALELIEPNLDRGSYTLITRGMSRRPMQVPPAAQGRQPELFRYAELVMGLPYDWPLSAGALTQAENAWPIKLLAELALFPHKNKTWLGVGHSVPSGDPARPYTQSTEACCALIAPLFEVDEGFKLLKLRPAKRTQRGYEAGSLVHFYGVIPIFEAEMNYKLERGAEDLLDLLETHQVSENLRRARKSVLKKKRFWLF